MMYKWRTSLFTFLLVGVLGLVFLVSGSVNAAPPADTISYWKLDEANGPNYIDSVGGNDGVGNVNPASVPGQVNDAQQFNGSTTGIDVLADVSFDWLATDGFSIECWVKGPAVPPGGTQVFIGRNDVTPPALQWWVGIRGTTGVAGFKLQKGADGATTLEGTTVLDDTKFYHVVGVRDANNITPPVNTISYWKLDEAGGPGYIDSVGGNDGVGSANPAPVAGQVNGAQQFNGSTTGIDVPADASFDWLATDSFSIECWVKGPAPATLPLGGTQVFIGRIDATLPALQWWVGIRPTGVAAFKLQKGTDGTTTLEGTTILNDTKFYHVVAVRDASANQNRLYVDGVLEGTLPATTYASGFDSLFDLNIGQLGATSDFLGPLDEIALYDKALTTAEVNEHYQAGLAAQGLETISENLLYVDGQLEGTQHVNYTDGFDSLVDLNIGQLGAGFDFLGPLDEIALYDRALPPTEVQEHYDHGLAGKGIDTLVPPTTPPITPPPSSGGGGGGGGCFIATTAE